jgi:gag-polypeptide of LTR copia-type
MILRVEDNQLVHMISPDPIEIWLTLQRIHQAAGFATSLSLRQKFLTAKKSDHQTMQAWIGQIQGLAFCMEHVKIAVTDQDKILAITMGLPPSFNNVIINFDSMSPGTLTLDLVIAHLLNEEV